MGIFFRLLGPILSLLILGAHFFRRAPMPAVKFILVGMALGLILLLLIPNRWTVKPVQLMLLLGGWEWVRTLISGVAERQAAGEPYLRMALILGGVAIFTFFTAFLPSMGRLRRDYYGRSRSAESAPEA